MNDTAPKNQFGLNAIQVLHIAKQRYKDYWNMNDDNLIGKDILSICEKLAIASQYGHNKIKLTNSDLPVYWDHLNIDGKYFDKAIKRKKQLMLGLEKIGIQIRMFGDDYIVKFGE